MDLNDTPELAAYRAEVRAWLDAHAAAAPAMRSARGRAARVAARAGRGRAGGGDVAGRVRRRRARAAAPGGRQPGDRARRRARALRRHRRRDARADDHRPRHRGPEAAPPRADAHRRRGLVPALLRARRRLRPRGRPDPRAPGSRRRQLEDVGPEGVDDQRPARDLRADARPHRPRRAQAQGPDHVRPADGGRGRRRPPAAPDLGRGALQRGLPRRRAPCPPAPRSAPSTAAGASR